MSKRTWYYLFCLLFGGNIGCAIGFTVKGDYVTAALNAIVAAFMVYCRFWRIEE